MDDTRPGMSLVSAKLPWRRAHSAKLLTCLASACTDASGTRRGAGAIAAEKGEKGGGCGGRGGAQAQVAVEHTGGQDNGTRAVVCRSAVEPRDIKATKPGGAVAPSRLCRAPLRFFDSAIGGGLVSPSATCAREKGGHSGGSRKTGKVRRRRKHPLRELCSQAPGLAGALS